MPAEFQCNAETLDQTVKKILLDFFEIEAYAVRGCYWDPPVGLSSSLFGDCAGEYTLLIYYSVHNRLSFPSKTIPKI